MGELKSRICQAEGLSPEAAAHLVLVTPDGQDVMHSDDALLSVAGLDSGAPLASVCISVLLFDVSSLAICVLILDHLNTAME